MRQLESPSLPAGVRDLLAPQVALFAAASVERELPWYMAQEIIPPRVRDTHTADTRACGACRIGCSQHVPRPQSTAKDELCTSSLDAVLILADVLHDLRLVAWCRSMFAAWWPLWGHTRSSW